MELNMFECIALGAGLNFVLWSGPILLFHWAIDNDWVR